MQVFTLVSVLRPTSIRTRIETYSPGDFESPGEFFRQKPIHSFNTDRLSFINQIIL